MATPGEIWINSAGRSISVVDTAGTTHVFPTAAIGTPPTALVTGEVYLHPPAGLTSALFWFKDGLGNTCSYSFGFPNSFTTSPDPNGSFYLGVDENNAAALIFVYNGDEYPLLLP